VQERKITYKFEFYSLDFTYLQENNVNCALFTGKVYNMSSEFHFKKYLSLLLTGEWKLQQLVWNRRPPSSFDSIEFIQQLVNKAAPLLYPINMWPGEQTEKGARLTVNQKIAPEDKKDDVTVSFRSQLLSIPSPSWDEIWSLIINRVKHDEHFKVQGFSNVEVIRAIEQLELVFPSSWVKKQFKLEAKNQNIDQSMGMEFPPESDFWYPAYHIGRTAIGSICIDPGWNFLVELGLAINDLKEVSGIHKIINSLTKYSGNQHCICLANDLNKRGLLNELEPLIGNGPYKNDITINYNGKILDIESKAFTSNKPDKALDKEIKKKIECLPNNYERPLIFYAVLIENGVFDRGKELAFYKAISNLSNELSDKITAVVGGKLFVDASGGHLKRDSEEIFVNPNAKHALSEDELRDIFKKNYSDVTYPIYGIGTYFYFSNETKNNNP
jgi:hypothetical protein